MGRKTRTKPFAGYKQHVITLLDADLIVEAVVRPANHPEYEVVALVTPAVATHARLTELFIDHGYLGSPVIGSLHAHAVAIRAKAWTTPNGDRFPKQAFRIDLGAQRVTVRRRRRRRSPRAWGRRLHHRLGGRSIAIHPQEALLQTLRETQQVPEGRARRTSVEQYLLAEPRLRVGGNVSGCSIRSRVWRGGRLEV